MEIYVQAKLRELGETRLARRALLHRPQQTAMPSVTQRPLPTWQRVFGVLRERTA